MSYNLFEERWIPILWTNSKVSRVGIKDALTQAHRVGSISTANPLDVFAVHRFLLTLLYWKADLAGGVEQVRSALLNGELPTAVLDSIKKEEHCFDLFDKEAPFLQDISVSSTKETDKKSVGSLFADLASGTNIAHFHHGDDENMRLCLPCATLGLLRAVPWTQAGGAGLTPSVHNAPPIMTLAKGDSLAVTLGLNLVPLNTAVGIPQWSGHFKPTNSIGQIPYMEAFTWNPRRIFLPMPEQGTCWYCGKADTASVGKIVYKKNEDTKQQTQRLGKLFEWQDPAAFYAAYDTTKKYDKDKNAPYRTKKSFDENKAKDGSDLADLSDVERSRLPAVFEYNRDHDHWLLVIPSTDPANNKTFDHRVHELTNLSREMISSLVSEKPLATRRGFDGWDEPRLAHPEGVRQFAHAAVELLTQADWVSLSNAAYLDMHESPAAFDVFSSLYWGLREKKIVGLPSPEAAWLVLKLMAFVPARTRVLHADAMFCPYSYLPKRQSGERDRASPYYPVSFPHGRRLEAALRGILLKNLRRRKPEPVDWIGLCHGLNQLM